MLRFFLLVFLISNINAYCQNYSITGIITNSLSEPLPYTNILAKPLSQQIDMAFAITDEQGRYKLVLQQNEMYIVTVSYLGFQPYSFVLLPKK